MPVINWQGKNVDGLEIRFKSNREEWNEYTLDDGSTLRMKAVVSEIFRIADQYDPEGNPLYVVKSANMLVVKAPDDLKKKN